MSCVSAGPTARAWPPRWRGPRRCRGRWRVWRAAGTPCWPPPGSSSPRYPGTPHPPVSRYYRYCRCIILVSIDITICKSLLHRSVNLPLFLFSNALVLTFCAMYYIDVDKYLSLLMIEVSTDNLKHLQSVALICDIISSERYLCWIFAEYCLYLDLVLVL